MYFFIKIKNEAAEAYRYKYPILQNHTIHNNYFCCVEVLSSLGCSLLTVAMVMGKSNKVTNVTSRVDWPWSCSLLLVLQDIDYEEETLRKGEVSCLIRRPSALRNPLNIQLLNLFSGINISGHSTYINFI